MSTTRNDEAQAQKGGEFHPSIERDEQQTNHGHKPGVLTGNEKVPEFEAKTLPPGSAPASKTFQPNTQAAAPPQDMNSEGLPAVGGGATSGDVHTGLGHPGQGQSSAELHHDGQAHRKNAGQSLEGVGAMKVGQSTVDEHDPKFAQHRVLDSDVAETGRGNVGGPSAEERLPEGAQTVASENKLPRN